MTAKPSLSFWQIWNMCFGFLGIQFGFALQNANVSRIFETLGAKVDDIPMLWIAAPLTGLIVQPVIGYLSDRTWTPLGRRRPYFLGGAVLATLALFVMPHSSVLWVAAGTLWVLDASINVAMEPFRAFVGDQLAPKQRPTGYAMQSFFIGAGSVIASMLPYLLAHAGVANTAGPGGIPDTVRYSFYVGGVVLLGAMLWTILGSREYSPEQLAAFDDAHPARPAAARALPAPARRQAIGLAWLVAGLAASLAVWAAALDKQLYVLAGGVAVYGLLVVVRRHVADGRMFSDVIDDLQTLPPTMRQLAVVQFFSWFALFAMWIYCTSAVTQVHYGTQDPQSAAYNEGANWVGVLFAAYNGFAALAAVVIPWMVRRWGLRASHMVNLGLGGLGLLSFLLIRDPAWLLLSMVGVGFAWASIVSLPYALLSDSLPAEKMGVYMGIFNFFIVIPQLVAVSLLGFMLRHWLGNAPIHVLAVGGVSLLVAAACVLRVRHAEGAP